MATADPIAIFPAAEQGAVAALARHLALTLKGGEVIRLEGPLGAGKTHFARALVRALLDNPCEDVPSPSFTLVQTYDLLSGGSLWHVDLYRLDGSEGTAELGLDDAGPDDISLIEWPDRLGPAPMGALTISLQPVPQAPDLREVTLSGDAVRWGPAARAAECAQLAARAGWADARVEPLAGDASARRYLRLTLPQGSAVLMDAAPGSCGPYLHMTDWLRSRGFHAPEVLAADTARGLLLLEDLGDNLLARAIDAQPALAQPAYLRVADLLAALHREPPAPEILALDGRELAQQVGLFDEWYAPAVGAALGAAAQVGPAIAELHAALAKAQPPVTALRDFHAENIVWRGDAPLGLLDFQDAVAAHPAYDLVSALQDPRRDVPPEIEAAAIARYCQQTGTDPDEFAAAYALLGAQRNLRIMGIFTRLCLRDAKPRYLAFMPRCWGLIARNLAHPALAPLAEAVRAVPPPTPDLVERIAQRCGTMRESA
ncbi:tRNA (adenosine(37)-N6)-threonylcarbamoyltransferase complex ATPase subunit type 1 TsaE [Paracoccus suum]|uniref:tRNA threonylcarbamoyladenosine biosynthesis protein TsaE n=1 Tax=Paracoccus suum TaxID=2259340 RepID=A0A344PHQ5_9RHOB|nr:tRNA (adenosine(37)-N6)-threonylcarbamoyltransferase complex ATPase subunit type 1 TsaE [Paracoccus suum]AXC48910.1 tRNA (adenosine(37)-N6)-threonylcarbamoyltransferase complex ATPase subunit type 1 TsaE [Paracoccus suum]